jgi:hypothetical protein
VPGRDDTMLRRGFDLSEHLVRLAGAVFID